MSNLKFSQDFVEFLVFSSQSRTRDSIISQIILNGDSSHLLDEGNFIKPVKEEIDVVSYLPASRYGKIEDVWSKGRTRIKIGRFVRKFLSEFSITHFEITEKMIENFVNTYKSYFSRDLSKLKIVQGEEIKKYYLESNYHQSALGKVGPLWNSCMRQSERNKFLKLYSENQTIKMLVFFSEDDKVRARALLWDEVKEHKSPDENYKFMDRIYYVYDHDVDFFKDWAKQNGYLTKYQQNAKSELYFDSDEGPVKKNLYVNLPLHNFTYYPYLDTFKFYETSKGRFSNSDSYSYDYKLVQSNGALEREPEPEEFYDEDN